MITGRGVSGGGESDGPCVCACDALPLHRVPSLGAVKFDEPAAGAMVLNCVFLFGQLPQKHAWAMHQCAHAQTTGACLARIRRLCASVLQRRDWAIAAGAQITPGRLRSSSAFSCIAHRLCDRPWHAVHAVQCALLSPERG